MGPPRFRCATLILLYISHHKTYL
ncbi:hypothetical protein LINPERPRIM_LOCUS12865 [Linum perenne]